VERVCFNCMALISDPWNAESAVVRVVRALHLCNNLHENVSLFLLGTQKFQVSGDDLLRSLGAQVPGKWSLIDFDLVPLQPDTFPEARWAALLQLLLVFFFISLFA